MKVNYLNHTMAAAISSAHQHLVGQPFDPKDPEAGCIRHVLVAPYSRIIQWKFVQALLAGVPYENAITMNQNDRYDVILLPEKRYVAGEVYPVKPIRIYYEEQEQPFVPGAFKPHPRTAAYR